jgi:hypothetical protein
MLIAGSAAIDTAARRAYRRVFPGEPIAAERQFTTATRRT